MNLKAMLLVGVCLAVAAGIARFVRRPPPVADNLTNRQHFQRAYDELVEYLRAKGEEHWVKRLMAIGERIGSPQQQQEGLDELQKQFGGMGSLNDLYYPDDKGTFDRLAGDVFKYMKLFNLPDSAREEWDRLAQRSRLAPRIQNAFEK